MPLKCRINEDCIACGACLDECPNDAISEGDLYVVDQTKCKAWDNCKKCAEVCPTDACIFEDK